MIIAITGVCDTIPLDVECVGSPDNIIICKKVNKLVYKMRDFQLEYAKEAIMCELQPNQQFFAVSKD